MATGIFLGLPLPILYTLRDNLANGADITSTSGGGISVSFATLSAAEKMAEVAYAIQVLETKAQGRIPPKRVQCVTTSQSSL